MSNTPINGLPSPDDNSPNDPPIHFDALNGVLDTRLNARFATVAARDAAISSPVNGMRCWVDNPGRFYDRIGGAWKVAAGTVLAIYDATTAWTGTGPFGAGVAVNGTLQMFTYTTPDPGGSFYATLTIGFEGGSGGAGTRWDFEAGRGGTGNASLTNYDMPMLFVNEDNGLPRYKYQTSRPIGPLTGAQTWRILARRIYGTGDGALSGANKAFTVTLTAA